MIIETLNSLENYNLNETFAKAFEYIRSLTPELEEGMYEIDGKKLFALVSSYKTKALTEGFPEAHKTYIDIQLLLSGEEIIACCPIDGLEVKEPYDRNNDVMFFKRPPGTMSSVSLYPGICAIFFPWDAHAPQIMVGETPRHVKKVVIKLKRSEAPSKIGL